MFTRYNNSNQSFVSYQIAKGYTRFNYNNQRENLIIAFIGKDSNNNDKFNDTLISLSLANQLFCPVILCYTNTYGETNYLTDYLNWCNKNNYQVKTVYLVGYGTASLPISDYQALSNKTIVPLNGGTRYGTAVEVAKKVRELSGTDKTNEVVFIAVGDIFPDSLSIAAASALEKYTLLYLPEDTNSDDKNVVYNYLKSIKDKIRKVFIIGGTMRVFTTYANYLKDHLELKIYYSNQIERVSGRTRYETNCSVNKEFSKLFTGYQDLGKKLVICTGEKPESLMAAEVAMLQKSPIFLVRQGSQTLNDVQIAYLQTFQWRLPSEQVIVFGAEEDISNAYVNYILNIMGN